MRQFTHRIVIATRGSGLYEFTGEVQKWVSASGLITGLLTLFIQHTSASLTIQENADPDVLGDLNAHFARLAPKDLKLYKHRSEGLDDMPAHIRAALTATQVSIPLIDGHLALGTWQGIYVFEHRDPPHRRMVALHLSGE